VSVKRRRRFAAQRDTFNAINDTAHTFLILLRCRIMLRTLAAESTFRQ